MVDFELIEPCGFRPIRFQGLLEFDDWRIKEYSIAYRGERARLELRTAAEDLARRVFPRPALEDRRYGVGFLGVHDGRGGHFVFCDWWQDENELHHRVFLSPSDSPAAFEDRTASGPTACVWDLMVICHERRAWLERVLRNPSGPDLSAYLADVLNTEA